MRDRGDLPDALLVNDLEPAALALAPSIGDARDAVARTGADHVMVSGSGPTVLGLFRGDDGPERARRAAAALDGSIACEAVA